MSIRYKGKDEYGRMVFGPADPAAFSKVTAEPPRTLFVFDEPPAVIWEGPADSWAAKKINLGAPVNSEEFFKTLGVPARVFRGEANPDTASAEYERWRAGRDAVLRETFLRRAVGPLFEAWTRSALEPATSPLVPEAPAADEPTIVENK